LGPGTHIKYKMKHNVLPVNQLDAFALAHDNDYLSSRNVNDRDIADDVAIQRMESMTTNKHISALNNPTTLSYLSAQMLKLNKKLRVYGYDFGK